MSRMRTCFWSTSIRPSFWNWESLEGSFQTLWLRFWERYLERSGDREMLEVAAPFFAWRALVMASLVWYPALGEGVRRKLFEFVLNVLAAERFEPSRGSC